MNSAAIHAIGSTGPEHGLRGRGFRWWVRAGCSGVLLAWAAFWTWFAASVAASEGGVSWLYAGSFIAPLWLLGALAWWKPRIGGLLLIAAGAGAFVYFHNDFTRATLALPAIAIGALLTLVGGPRGSATPA